MSVGLLIDTVKCIGCGACSEACKEENDLPYPIEDHTTAYTWTTLERFGEVSVRKMCMHCLEPTCASVCPVGALVRSPEGPVTYEAGKCIGCRYCIMACPFGVPKYQWDRALPVVGKCILCTRRVKEGKPTACAEACLVKATLFGEREALITEARRRMAARPGTYVDHIYGLDEAGGTSVMVISKVPFAQLGMKTDVPRQPLPLLTWQILSRVPDFVVLAGTFLWGLHWITHRRELVAATEPRPRRLLAAPPGANGWRALWAWIFSRRTSA